MCNSCNSCNSCCCNGGNSLISALNNLFGPPCGCNNNSLARTLNNLFGSGNGSCGCGCNGWNNFSNGFVSGVNAANAANSGGCGCNGGNGSFYGGNGSSCCFESGFDAYYAQQYALGPYSSGSCGVCGY